MVLAALIAGASGCAYVTHTVSHSTEKLRLEVKEDLKPLAALNTTVTVMQETLKAVQETQKAMQETQKAMQTKLDAVLLGVGLLGIGVAFLHKPK